MADNQNGRSKSGDVKTAANSKAGSRSRSETPLRGGTADKQTPPRPSPPKEYDKKGIIPQRPSPPRIVLKNSKGRKNEAEDAPPRPPPPVSYTSTLPPPVPKKVGKPKFSSKTLPARKVSTPKQKPLEKIQPLQVSNLFLHLIYFNIVTFFCAPYQ